MNLLKVLMLVGLAASLILLIPTTACATDHPWDDNDLDSARVQGQIHSVITDDSTVVPKPFTDTPVITRVRDWVRGILREAREIFTPQIKQVIREKPADPNRRPDHPVVKRKNT